MTTLVVVRKGNMATIAAKLTPPSVTLACPLTVFDASSENGPLRRHRDRTLRQRAHQLVYENLFSASDLSFNSKAEIFETFRKLHAILKDQHFLNPKGRRRDATRAPTSPR